MEIVSFVILGMIAVAIVSYCAGKRHSTNEYEITKANLEYKQSELDSLRLSYKIQQKRYDDLYDSFLRVNKYNKELLLQLQEKSHSYEELAEKMYIDLHSGKSRHEISMKYRVPYTTVCLWLRKKTKEMEDIETELRDNLGI